MKWTTDCRHETEWEDWFAWHPVSLEMDCDSLYARGIYKSCWFERIERRSLSLPNNRTLTIYREFGSAWDLKLERPGLPASMKPKE